MGCKGKGVVTVRTDKGGDGSAAIGRPSGSEWEALEIIHELGKAGRHGVGGRMHVGPAYADYVCRSLLNKGLIERSNGDVFVLTEGGKKIFENIEAEKPKAREIEKAEPAHKEEVGVKECMEYKIP